MRTARGVLLVLLTAPLISCRTLDAGTATATAQDRPGSPQGQVPGLVTLRFNEPQRLPGGSEVTWFDTRDSRCPEGVTCVWAGEARIRLRVTGQDAAVELVLPAAGPTRIGDDDVELQEVRPYPREDPQPGKQEEAAAVLSVTSPEAN